MDVQAITRSVRMSPQKVRRVTNEIRGMGAMQAAAALSMVTRKSSRLVAKTLKSAIANAENNHDLRAENLRIKEAVVGDAPTMKRFVPKARGSAGPILKRSSHIKIVLTDDSAE